MTACWRTGCGRRGTHSVVASVPARGFPRAMHEPLKVYCTMVLCREHADAEVKADCPGPFGEEARQAMHATVVDALGRAEPDWSRAEYEAVRVDSREYREFLLTIVDRGTVH